MPRVYPCPLLVYRDTNYHREFTGASIKGQGFSGRCIGLFLYVSVPNARLFHRVVEHHLTASAGHFYGQTRSGLEIPVHGDKIIDV